MCDKWPFYINFCWRLEQSWQARIYRNGGNRLRSAGIEDLRMHAREKIDQQFALGRREALEQMLFALQRHFDDAVVQAETLAGQCDQLPVLVFIGFDDAEFLHLAHAAADRRLVEADHLANAASGNTRLRGKAAP